mmetsp:Transcript_33355/g.55971  ORF Transcript_33355/g.55971 Transcript_33355/m.55971 type:complete len:256 (+) Transcript_33355:466-1233(+)
MHAHMPSLSDFHRQVVKVARVRLYYLGRLLHQNAREANLSIWTDGQCQPLLQRQQRRQKNVGNHNVVVGVVHSQSNLLIHNPAILITQCAEELVVAAVERGVVRGRIHCQRIDVGPISGRGPELQRPNGQNAGAGAVVHHCLARRYVRAHPLHAQPRGRVFARSERQPRLQENVDGGCVHGFKPGGHHPHVICHLHANEGVLHFLYPVLIHHAFHLIRWGHDAEDPRGGRHSLLDVDVLREQSDQNALFPHPLTG